MIWTTTARRHARSIVTTLPAELARRLGVTAGDQIVWTLMGNRVAWAVVVRSTPEFAQALDAERAVAAKYDATHRALAESTSDEARPAVDGSALADLWDRAVQALGDEGRARHWLVAPRRSLEGRTPVEAVLEGDAARVYQLFGAIMHGNIV